MDKCASSEFDLEPSFDVLNSMCFADAVQELSGTKVKITYVDAYFKALKVWNYLVKSLILKAKGLIFRSHPTGHCFKVEFPKNSTVKYLSISVPHDCNYSLSSETCIETALCNDEENLIYDDNLGYDDVCRFCCPEDVEQELIRLCEFKKQ